MEHTEIVFVLGQFSPLVDLDWLLVTVLVPGGGVGCLVTSCARPSSGYKITGQEAPGPSQDTAMNTPSLLSLLAMVGPPPCLLHPLTPPL